MRLTSAGVCLNLILFISPFRNAPSIPLGGTAHVICRHFFGLSGIRLPPWLMLLRGIRLRPWRLLRPSVRHASLLLMALHPRLLLCVLLPLLHLLLLHCRMSSSPTGVFYG